MKKYFLNIHHRDIGVDINCVFEQRRDPQYPTIGGKTCYEYKSVGHFYLSLEVVKDGVKTEEYFFGKYPQSDSKPLSLLVSEHDIQRTKEEIRHEYLYRDDTKFYHGNHNLEYKPHGTPTIIRHSSSPKPHVNTIRLEIPWEEEYLKALNFARSHTSSNDYYIIGVLDCVDFVQSVYHAAGFEKYFTIHYSEKDLLSLETYAAYSAFWRYGSANAAREFVSEIYGMAMEKIEAFGTKLGISAYIPMTYVMDYPMVGFMDDHMLHSFGVNLGSQKAQVSTTGVGVTDHISHIYHQITDSVSGHINSRTKNTGTVSTMGDIDDYKDVMVTGFPDG